METLETGARTKQKKKQKQLSGCGTRLRWNNLVGICVGLMEGGGGGEERRGLGGGSGGMVGFRTLV